MGYSPWGRKESDRTEATEHVLRKNVPVFMSVSPRDGCGEGLGSPYHSQ